MAAPAGERMGLEDGIDRLRDGDASGADLRTAARGSVLLASHRLFIRHHRCSATAVLPESRKSDGTAWDCFALTTRRHAQGELNGVIDGSSDKTETINRTLRFAG